MPRRFRLWQKKRGSRRTGSPLAGTIGEGTLFAALMMAGFVGVIALVTSRLTSPTGGGDDETPGYGLWLAVVILVSLILTGAGRLIYILLYVSTSAERRSAMAQKAKDFDLIPEDVPPSKDYPEIPYNKNLFNSPGTELAYRLPLSISPAWEIFGTMLYALLWNGIFASVAVMSVQGFVAGQPRWIATLLAVPLVVLAVKTTHRFLIRLVETTGIGATSVEVSDLPLYPARNYKVCLVQQGRGRVRSLEMRLACDEEATFRQGTNVRTERRRVHDERIFCQRELVFKVDEPFVHESKFQIPVQAMHSFQSTSNSIQWRLLVIGRMARGSRFERSFPVVVYPAPSLAS